MKINLCHILILFLCIPLGVVAQQYDTDTQLDFYQRLAYRDAQYEQLLQKDGEEDEVDYWRDQREFEKQLHLKSPKFYQAYLDGKHIAYGQYQKKCTDCTYSEMYSIQASYYAVKGRFNLNSNTTLSSEDTKRIKTLKIVE